MLGRQRPRGLTTCLALCAMIAALSGACKASDPRTQVMLVIDADDEVRARATELDVEFESRSELDQLDGVPYTETFSTADGAMPSWPYSIALVPRNNDARRSYRIRATLYEGETLIAELRAHSGFVAQRTLELRLVFSADCLDERSLDCSDQETCYDGECWRADIDPHSLPSLGGEAFVPASDGGVTSSSDVRTGSQMRADGGTAGQGGMSAPGRRGTAGASGAAAADGGMDADMPARMTGGNCGDGVWNDEEECDTAIPQGTPGACRESCPLAEACKPLQLEGTGCQTHCEEYPVQSAIAGDGCCLEGSDSNSDPDCDSRCGNGIQEAGEACDGNCPTDTSACPQSNGCQTPVIVGDAASCSAQCVMREVEVCMAGDGCCGAAGCTYANDTDCSPSCGNGMVEDALGELCEPGSVDRPCPTTCDDGDPCTDDITTGTAANCNVRCDHTPVTRTTNADGCCPPGRGNANNDSDCTAACGNRVIERGEFCDGNCPTQAAQCEDFIPCTTNGLAPSACGMRCNFTLILAAANGDMCCPLGANATNDNDCQPVCGNGIPEGGEACDGNCPTSCPRDTDNDPCTANVVTNTGCQRRCASQRLTANINGPDGCCPPNANPSTDSDCMPPAAMCGNGVREAGEMCDPCPTSCPEPSNCMRFELTGSGCNAACAARAITAPANDDNCCPNGANSGNDNDCAPTGPMCGNDMVETGETCDPCPTSCPEPRDCMRFVLRGSGCNVTCMPVPITAPAPGDSCCPAGENSSTDRDCTNPPPAMCGNGRTEPGENCDGSDCPSCADTDPCTEDIRIDVPDACHPQCRHMDIPPRRSGPDGCCPVGNYSDTDSDCPPPPAECGNGRVEPPEECDNMSDTCRNCRVVSPPDPPPVPTPDP